MATLPAIPSPAALEELSLPLEQRVKIGGLQPCRQPAALAVIQVVSVHQLISDMYEGYRPYLPLLRHMAPPPSYRVFRGRYYL